MTLTELNAAIDPRATAWIAEALALVGRLLDAEEASRYADDGARQSVEWRSVFARAPEGVMRILRSSTSDELDALLLLLAASPYLDVSIRDRYRALQGSVLADRCSVSLAMSVVSRSAEERLSLFSRFDEDRPLFRDGLVRLERPSDARGDAVLERSLCVPEQTIDRLLGRVRLDARLRPYCRLETTPVAFQQVILADDRRALLLALVQHHDRYREALRSMQLDRAVPYGRGLVLLFSGPSGTGKTLLARALASGVGRPLMRVFSGELAEAEESFESLVSPLWIDANHHGAVVFFDECDGLFGRESRHLGYLLAELERFEGIAILATNRPERLDPSLERRITHRFDLDTPTPMEREQIWEVHLPASVPVSSDVDLRILANRFQLTGGAIKNAVLSALNAAIAARPSDPLIDMAGLLQAAEYQLRSRLEEFAQKSVTQLSLVDLILPPDIHARVVEVMAACQNLEMVQVRWGFAKRLPTGRGLNVLFDGPPGTGKTLCAEILARELGRPLFRVHVPNVVSKWVGETERNISEVFSRARGMQGILLFDEADSLFSRRTDVTSANDRFANQEVNLLLQELERHEGIVILTTNLFGSLDDAVRRRLQYRVSFPMPTAAERAAIWERLIPPEAPVSGDVAFEQLASRFDFAGGNIKNAVVRAAFRACQDGSPITHRHLLEAGRLECESMGMAVREGQAAVVSRPRPT